ncbi:MAG: hypothetical protein ACK502_06695 [Alphaproteobacteria bacterium]
MNLRAVLIIFALLTPVLALSTIAQQADTLPPPPAPASKNANSSQPNAPIDPRRPPATLEEAKERLRRRLADLEKMTEGEWQKEQKRKHQELQKKSPNKWDALTPEQKIDSVINRQKKIDEGRAKDIPSTPAKPAGELSPPAKP